MSGTWNVVDFVRRLHHPQLRLKDALLSAFQRLNAHQEAYGRSYPAEVLRVCDVHAVSRFGCVRG